MNLIPYTNFNIPDYTIAQQETGRKNLSDILFDKPKIEIIEVEAEEVPNEENKFNQQAAEAEVESNLIKGSIFVLSFLLFMWLIKKFVK